MAPKQRIIIDTDPGCDDTLAMLLALSANPEELEVVMLSVTYGNVPLDACLKNTVAIFQVLDKELQWRRENGIEEGFPALKTYKPIIAAGPSHPLEDDELVADYFHGLDGLHNVHATHPHLAPEGDVAKIFDDHASGAADHSNYSKYFTPAKLPAHKEILRLLKENPADSITILAVGPLTNVALAASEDPETFLRVKEVVVMGGAVAVEGNVTPVAEFNTFADVIATARVFALTSRTPNFTLPPKTDKTTLPPYPDKLSRQLNLTLCPLDITTPHEIGRTYFNSTIKERLAAGSPLAVWTSHFLSGAFSTIERFWHGDGEPGLSLHDPLTVWYMLCRDDPKWKLMPQPEDIRIETEGQWARGQHIADRRGKRKPAEDAVAASQDPLNDPEIIALDTVKGDEMGWLSVLKGNRVNRIIESPGEELFREVIMQRIFNLS